MSILLERYCQVCMQLQNLRKIAKNRKPNDFSCYLRFFVVLCHVNEILRYFR